MAKTIKNLVDEGFRVSLVKKLHFKEWTNIALFRLEHTDK